MSRYALLHRALSRGKNLTGAATTIHRVCVAVPNRSANGGATAFKYNDPVDPYQARHEASNVPDLNMQSIVLPGPERIRVSSYVNDSCYKPDQFFSEAPTLYEAFLRGQKVSNDGPFLGARTGPNRTYEWMAFSQVAEKSRLLGSGFIAQGNKPGSCLGIFAQNRPEWTITDLACMQYSIITVPLYNSMGWKSCQYVVNKSE